MMKKHENNSGVSLHLYDIRQNPKHLHSHVLGFLPGRCILDTGFRRKSYPSVFKYSLKEVANPKDANPRVIILTTIFFQKCCIVCTLKLEFYLNLYYHFKGMCEFMLLKIN